MYGSTSQRLTPPCPSLSYKGEPHVSIMQDMRRYSKSEPLYPYRSGESHSRHMVSRGVDESHRERVRGVEHSRSVALGGNNRRAVQAVRQHVFKDQTRSQRLPPGLRNGRAETPLYRGVLPTRGNPT